ncbi:MAG: sigma-54-dependent Fis family transcriptional regulator [Rhodobacteraceae bacterium]|nr:sigma-54-dependent Fis family transcriptional regulator [Paracoccaceae bacterium]
MTRSPRPSILLVDDEPHSLASMRMALEDDFDILTADSAEQAVMLLQDEWVQVIFCDQRMPGRTGVQLLTEVRERWPEIVRIIVTGYTDPGDMADAINDAGIYQFLTKPWHPEQLLMAARNAADLFSMTREHQRLSLEMKHLSSTTETKLEKRRRDLRERQGFDAILRSPHSRMNAVIEAARQYASFDVPVLLSGEAGTGKQELARAMHHASLRAEKPFLALNCAGLPDDLLELELFGARRGAVPGLATNRIGLLQKADRGTLYLGGVESLSPRMQMALMRVLREGAVQPLGAHEAVRSNLRLICGMTGDLRALMAEGQLRADLGYAISAGEITLPPLRGRRGDVAILAQACLYDTAATHGKQVRGFDDVALGFLENYDWPGNLRELENEVARMLIFAQDPILGADLISRHILQADPGDEGADRALEPILTREGPLKDRVELVEMRILRETLTRHRWNKSRAAAELGLSRVGLRAKIERYGIEDPGEHNALQEEE